MYFRWQAHSKLSAPHAICYACCVQCCVRACAGAVSVCCCAFVFFRPCWSIFQNFFFLFPSCRCVVGCWSFVLARSSSSSSSGAPGNRISCLYAGVYVRHYVKHHSCTAAVPLVCSSCQRRLRVHPLFHVEHDGMLDCAPSAERCCFVFPLHFETPTEKKNKT